jgi:hypothetical protein
MYRIVLSWPPILTLDSPLPTFVASAWLQARQPSHSTIYKVYEIFEDDSEVLRYESDQLYDNNHFRGILGKFSFETRIISDDWTMVSGYWESNNGRFLTYHTNDTYVEIEDATLAVEFKLACL